METTDIAISVISVVAKLFEKLIYNQLRSFMTENDILVEQQSGFRSQHSTETLLLSSTNECMVIQYGQRSH